MKTTLPLVALALAGHLMIPVEGHAQQVPDWLLKLRLPNSSAKAIMTPMAWGAAFGSAYLGTGAAERTPYLPNADGIVGVGYGMGDPVLRVGLQIGTTISDLSEFDNVSFSFKLHRYLSRGTTIALGGESLLSNNPLPSAGLTKNSSLFSTPTVTQDVTQSVNHQLAPLCQPSGALFKVRI